MKRVVLFISLMSGFYIAVVHLTAADPVEVVPLQQDDGSAVSIVIKNGKLTNNWLTLDDIEDVPRDKFKISYPEYVESKGTRYLLDYHGHPDIKGFSSVVWWGGVFDPVLRVYVVGKLEFRTQKETERLQPVIVVKTLASGPMPGRQKSAESEINALENPFKK